MDLGVQNDILKAIENAEETFKPSHYDYLQRDVHVKKRIEIPSVQDTFNAIAVVTQLRAKRLSKANNALKRMQVFENHQTYLHKEEHQTNYKISQKTMKQYFSPRTAKLIYKHKKKIFFCTFFNSFSSF